MRLKDKLIYTLFLLPLSATAENISWINDYGRIEYHVNEKVSPVVDIALDMFTNDMVAVTGNEPIETAEAIIQIHQLDKMTQEQAGSLALQGVPVKSIANKNDAFYIGVKNGKVIVVGSNGRSTAYGILELSRKAGVSPWTWWGDVKPERKEKLYIDSNYSKIETPTIKYRGISLTNEEWSTKIWDNKRLEDENIGPVYYGKLFRLMLRLKANTLWQATPQKMEHFTSIKENTIVADSFNIYVMASAANTLHYQKELNNHRKINKKLFKKTGEILPLIFAPTDNILEKNPNGVKVQEDVTLLWSDDNYGYLSKLSNNEEKESSNGQGILYHLSYAGAPHDYLWLSTTQPGLIFNELRKAYDNNARSIWIANIHDPKIAAYSLNLFMDMAWDIKSVMANSVKDHLGNWLALQFGAVNGKKLLPIMTDFYHLTGIRKPEFMGWNELKGHSTEGDTKNTEFTESEIGNEIERYLAAYQQLRNKADNLASSIDPVNRNAYYAAIRYPIVAAYDMARMQLEAQEARSIARPGRFDKDEEALTAAANSLKAYQEIKTFTTYYNRGMAKGKWNGLMNDEPRKLAVFAKPSFPAELTDDQIKKFADETYEVGALESTLGTVTAMNASEYTKASQGVYAVELLGHSMKAVSVPKGNNVTYTFNAKGNGNALIRIAAIPTHPCTDGDMRFSISIDEGAPQTVSIHADVNSEEWKKAVLRGQVIRKFKANLTQGTHTIKILALDRNIVLDQLMVDFEEDRQFYIIPVEPDL